MYRLWWWTIETHWNLTLLIPIVFIAYQKGFHEVVSVHVCYKLNVTMPCGNLSMIWSNIIVTKEVRVFPTSTVEQASLFFMQLQSYDILLYGIQSTTHNIISHNNCASADKQHISWSAEHCEIAKIMHFYYPTLLFWFFVHPTTNLCPFIGCPQDLHRGFCRVVTAPCSAASQTTRIKHIQYS